MCYSRADESSWELDSEWWFPSRRTYLWGTIHEKIPLLSVFLSENNGCGKVQDESSWKNSHLITLKLLILTIVLVFNHLLHQYEGYLHWLELYSGLKCYHSFRHFKMPYSIREVPHQPLRYENTVHVFFS